ncbi:CaiB/BaiF CoA-transferase family protein [Rhodococcus sp. JVH1]|uniref:CaiB/BaiF CoA transferase family protein n=1 Tax=Rhodococcus sp. JVH1 TaxID=745408 RepID=UPI000271EB3B|nr:CaiB/BaiF CoA-transferase family protein [Rhodococcus sp. JVH1]EJI93557.1 coA-transferase family III family protein [Rhodococcus sp. JVH1]
MTGPLTGIKVVEFAGMGPAPFAGMLLADMGATVVRVQRAGAAVPGGLPGTGAELRGRTEVIADLKDADDRDSVRRLVAEADVLLEGYRPGVMERLGLGPDELLAVNPRLIYGRMTGYGQNGPLAQVPGHDINYLAIAGVLGAIRRDGERPLAPLNLVGDYGGGGMLLALGVVSALVQVARTGRGEVVDAAMVDGAAQLATLFFAFQSAGGWDRPGTNLLDSGAPFYEVYETADGGHMAVGAIESQFYVELLRFLDITTADAPQWDRDRWPQTKERFAAVFRTRTRQEWTDLLQHTDACATPVLTLDEAPSHPHNVARDSFRQQNELTVPSPAPRFGGRKAGPIETVALVLVLQQWGLSAADVTRLAGRNGEP